MVGFAEQLTPVALIGTGGIGKTSIALTVLHHDRIKQRFGNNRRFIRCDKFPASRTHFLGRLSKVIGAGIKNPEDFTSLQPSLSSKETLIILDSVESILDPQGTDAEEIYAVVAELCQFGNICLCITSRITTIPPDCKHLVIPTLSMEAAHDAFYCIYQNGKQSNLVSNILKQLDFHPLSITLLATVAHRNRWDCDRLIHEWDAHHTQLLWTAHNQSLGSTIELSLASPTLQELGPHAHDLLGIIAFFPQGVDENNLNWLFPTISNAQQMFERFCVLSLTYRSKGFITMLAPLRDYLCPRDPTLSPLLHTIKNCYFSRLSVPVNPGNPGFEEGQWIMSEDINVEHLLDIFTTTNADSVDVWDACAHFMEHLYWHKQRMVVLGPKIEGLPDGYPSKPQCLLQLSRLFHAVGDNVEEKQVLTHALKLWRELGDGLWVAQTLGFLAEVNQLLDLHEEGIQQVKEAQEIYEQLGDTSGQAHSLYGLALLLYGNKELDAAEEVISKCLPDNSEQSLICQHFYLLGKIYHSKGEAERAIGYFETALQIASSFNWHSQLFWIHYCLAQVFSEQSRFSDAHTHIECAKLHTTCNPYRLGCAMHLQACFWYNRHRFEEAKSETLCAVDVFKKLGATKDLENCKMTLRNIEMDIKNRTTSGGSGFDGKLKNTKLPTAQQMWDEGRTVGAEGGGGREMGK